MTITPPEPDWGSAPTTTIPTVNSTVGSTVGSTPATPASAPARRSLRELGIVALAAAVLASGGTYAAVSLSNHDALPSNSATTTAANTTTGGTAVSVAPNAADVAKAADAVTASGWSTIAAAVAPAVVSITVTSSTASGEGSGVIYDTSGHILTNNHVVSGAGAGATLTVTLNDGRTYGATVVGTDPSTDLAVVRLTNPPGDLTAIALGDSSALRVGDPVMAVGNPLGLAGTVTTGIVSALDRPVSTSSVDDSQGTDPRNPFGQGGGTSASSETVVTNAIQTSAAINPGNSGGALVNAKGELVGINSSIAQLGSSSSQSGNIGIGFAIPANEAAAIAKQLIATGKATHAYLGVSTKDTTVTVDGAQRSGAGVGQVTQGSPAATAGLSSGDVITAVNGERVDSALSLIGHIRELTVGDQATLTVVRDGSARTVKVTLAARPSQAQ